MKKYPLLALSAVLILGAYPQMSYAAKGCAGAFSSAFPVEGKARETSTQPDSKGGVSPTSATREAEIAKRSKLMENEVLGIGFHGDTPPIEFFAADGVDEKYLFHTDGVKGEPTRIMLSGVGPSGVVKGTLLLPVSGHTGAANAKAWAKTDTYTIYVEESKDAQGKQWGSSDGSGGKVLAKDADSLAIVTSHEVEVHLSKNHMTRFAYFRSGSGGPGGYFEGRILELLWDGT